MRGIKLSYQKQGLIYFTCQNYKDQPKSIQEKILRLCVLAGGDYDRALFEFLTQCDASAEGISQRHHVSTSVLYRCRKRFYEAW